MNTISIRHSLRNWAAAGLLLWVGGQGRADIILSVTGTAGQTKMGYVAGNSYSFSFTEVDPV